MPRPAAQQRTLASRAPPRPVWPATGRAAVVAALLASGGPRACAEWAPAGADGACSAEASLLQLAGSVRKEAHGSTEGAGVLDVPLHSELQLPATTPRPASAVDAGSNGSSSGTITVPLDSNLQVPHAIRKAESVEQLERSVLEGVAVADVPLDSELQLPATTPRPASAVDAGSNGSSSGTITVPLDSNLQLPHATRMAGSADRSGRSMMVGAGVADVPLDSELKMFTTTQKAASAVDAGSTDSSSGTITVPLDSNLQVPHATAKAGSADRPESTIPERAGVVDVPLNSELQLATTAQRAAAAVDAGSSGSSGGTVAVPLDSNLQTSQSAETHTPPPPRTPRRRRGEPAEPTAAAPGSAAGPRGLAHRSLLQALARRAAGGGTPPGGLGQRSLLPAFAEGAGGGGASVGWGAALGLGALYGLLHVLGPDHIGTLITLSATAAPARAFVIGTYWGCGHCLGMVVIGGAFLLADELSGGFVEAWECYGNYVIGVSMVAVALYFAFTESWRIEVHADGSSTLKACACCGPASADAASETKAAAPVEAARDDHFRCVPCPVAPRRAAAPQPAEPEPSGRCAEGALVGLLQGMCCPTGLLGIAFLAELSAWRVVVFTAAFVVISVLGTGLLAACWGHLTRGCCGAHVSHVALYRASCTFTLLLGVTWTLATFCGLLSKMDFTESVVIHQALLQK